jgi:hypothetical protein
VTRLLAFVLVGAACGAPEPCEIDENCPLDLVCGADGLCGSPATRFFAVSELGIVGIDGTTTRGFDLDGVISTGEGPTCVDRSRDYTSADDPSITGVDNGFGGRLDALAGVPECEGRSPEDCARALMTGRVADGTTLVVIEIRDFESWRTDSNVDVIVYDARVPGCPIDERCPPDLDGGTLAPDQRFEIAASGAARGGGVIDEGKLRVAFDAPILLRGEPDMSLRNARLEAQIGAGGLDDVLIGAALALSDLCPPAQCLPASMPSPFEAADLDPDPRDPSRCRSVSVTVSATAVPALAP